MSPALIQATAPARIRTMTRNRRRHTAARASLRRVTLATIAAGMVTLAALAVSALDRATAESRDAALERVARWTVTGAGPLTVSDLHSLPADLEAATWSRWSKRLAARHAATTEAALNEIHQRLAASAAQRHADRVNDAQADEDDIAAADARLMADPNHPDEADLEIASPAVRAVILRRHND